ncbi:MAG: MFS transporter [Bacteroidales bacterium]|nr:MFS transporter [Bacteroidales bacterium]
MSAKHLNWIAIGTMWAMLCMISFVTNIAAPFGNIWSTQYEWAGMAGNLMNFAAYLFMGVPAGALLVHFGYKRTILIALGIGALGMGTQLISGYVGAESPLIEVGRQPLYLNLFIYLTGALICGFCVCILNTCVNPMINLLGGGGNTGYQLIQAGGTLNSLVGSIAPMVAGMLIGTLTKESTITEVAPLCLVAMSIFIVSLIIVSFIRLEEPQGDLSQEHFEHSPLHFRHFRLGAIAIFFYVGTEVGIPSELNAWISHMTDTAGHPVEGAAAVAGSLAGIYWGLMMAGRFLATLISEKISPRSQMNGACLIAIVLLLLAQFTEAIPIHLFGIDIPLSCIFILLCGLCTAVLWAAIFNLATEGLGKYTAKASGIFMTMVVGGGIMPIVQENLLRPALGYLGSYVLIIGMFIYMFYYSMWGSKIMDRIEE